MNSIRFAFLLLLSAPAALAGSAPDPAQIDRWMAELGSADFDTREEAMERLWAAGGTAEAALRRAQESEDAEVRWRAESILKKHTMGIRPDTPQEILDLLRRYRQTAEPQARATIVGELSNIGIHAYPFVVRLALAEKDANRRRFVLPRALNNLGASLPLLIGAGGSEEEVEAFIELAAAHGNLQARRHYAAYQLVSGTLDEKCRSWRAKVEEESSPEGWETIALLERARGELDAAARAAATSDNRYLQAMIHFERRDWPAVSAIFEHQMNAPNGSWGTLDRLALGAFTAHLAGDFDTFERRLAALRERGAHARLANTLILAYRPDEAADALVKAGKTIQAFELLCKMRRFKEAFALAEKKLREKPAQLEHYEELENAYLIRKSALDRREASSDLATAIERRISSEPSDDKSPNYQLIDLIRLEADVAPKPARRHIAAILASATDEIAQAEILDWYLITHWKMASKLWLFLRLRFPEETLPESLTKLERLTAPRPGTAEISDLILTGEEHSRALPAEERPGLLHALAMACRRADDREREMALYGRAVECPQASSWLLEDLADLQMEIEAWGPAAENYLRAWHQKPYDGRLLWLSGLALTRAGRAEAGRRRMDRAQLALLGNGGLRFDLAEEMARQDLAEEAARVRVLSLRLGAFALDTSWGTYRLREAYFLDLLNVAMLPDPAADGGDDLLETHMLGTLFRASRHNEPAALFNMLYSSRVARARRLLADGKIGEAVAIARAAAALAPGRPEAAAELAPELIRAGRVKEAEDLFQTARRALDQGLADWPQSTLLHCQAAELLARCHRDLDQALEHAEKARSLWPEDEEVLLTLAEVHFQRGEREKAVARAEEATARMPDTLAARRILKRYRTAPLPEAPAPEE